MPKTLLSVHWAPLHRKGEDRDIFARWNPPFVKIVGNGDSIPYVEDVPAGAKVVARSYEVSENFFNRGFGSETPETMAAKHAAFLKKLADGAVAKGVSKDRLVFEGLNEPMLWASEPPAQVAAYYKAFTVEMHKLGLHVCVGNFGVGWPNNTGPDTPVDWQFFQPVIAVMDANDYLGLHEYWGSNGVDNAMNAQKSMWKWWAGRYEQCPFKVNILITECGIDLGVEGKPKQGWMNIMGGTSLDAKAQRYVGELFWYEDKLRADRRIKGACIYSYDGNRDDWAMFSIDVDVFLNPFLATLQTRPPVVEAPVVVEPPVTVKTLESLLREAFGPNFADTRTKLPQHASLRYAARSVNTIKRIVVHHGGSAVTTAANIARYHVVSKGWPGIGYHFLVHPTGRIEYVGDINLIRYHAGDANTDSIGICMNGNYMDVTAPRVMLDTLETLVRVLETCAGKTLAVKGHRDLAAGTVCPGNKLYAQLFGQQEAQPPKPSDESFRQWGWEVQAVRYNAVAALTVKARELGLGAPLSDEYEIGDWIQQNFAGAILRVKKNEWTTFEVTQW